MQGTIYRNAQLRYTHIMYCTLWEKCKQTQCPHRSWREWMWYYSPTKNKLIYQVRANTYDFWLSGQYGKYNSNIFLFHPLGPFPTKMMRCPWILCFDLLPLQYTDLTHEIWRFLVYIFLGEISQKMGRISLAVLRLVDTNKPTNGQLCIKMESITDNCLIRPELKTLEWNILNPDRLINLEINNKSITSII